MQWLRRGRRKQDPTCDICQRRLRLGSVRLVSGSGPGERPDAEKQVEVIFRDLPVLSCPEEGHPRRFAAADFGVYVIDAVFWQGQVPLGRPGALAKVKCFKCGKNLSKEPVRASEVAGLLNIAGLPEFGIRIKGPVTTCPRCQSEQLWASKEIGGEVSNAMVAAFMAAGL